MTNTKPVIKSMDENEMIRLIKKEITTTILEDLPYFFERLRNIKDDETYVSLMLQLLGFVIPQIKPVELQPMQDEEDDWLSTINMLTSHANRQ